MVYTSTLFKLTDLFILYFFIHIYANKKLFQKKDYKIMYKGSNFDQKSHLSEILTEPWNPREGVIQLSTDSFIYRVEHSWEMNINLNQILSISDNFENGIFKSCVLIIVSRMILAKVSWRIMPQIISKIKDDIHAIFKLWCFIVGNPVAVLQD